MEKAEIYSYLYFGFTYKTKIDNPDLQHIETLCSSSSKSGHVL